MDERGMEGSHCPHDMGVISPSPFRFQLGGKRPISDADWRLVQAFDPNRTVAHTDLDALERLLGTVVSGDLESEDFRHITPGNVNRLFRAAQLVVEYLLYVQELLAAENSMVKAELTRVRHQAQELHRKAQKLRDELLYSKREAKCGLESRGSSQQQVKIVMPQGGLRVERAAQEVVKRQLDLLEARLTEIVAGYACPSCRAAVAGGHGVPLQQETPGAAAARTSAGEGMRVRVRHQQPPKPQHALSPSPQAPMAASPAAPYEVAVLKAELESAHALQRSLETENRRLKSELASLHEDSSKGQEARAQQQERKGHGRNGAEGDRGWAEGSSRAVAGAVPAAPTAVQESSATTAGAGLKLLSVRRSRDTLHRQPLHQQEPPREAKQAHHRAQTLASAVRGRLEEQLVGEVLEQLSALGVDLRGTTGLTDVQFRAALTQLSSRRAALRAELSADEAVCIDRIRHKLTTHIEQSVQRAITAGQSGSSGEPSTPPHGSLLAAAGVSERGAAFYSPLHIGTCGFSRSSSAASHRCSCEQGTASHTPAAHATASKPHPEVLGNRNAPWCPAPGAVGRSPRCGTREDLDLPPAVTPRGRNPLRYAVPQA